jgi:hypothetical protein
MVQLYSTSYLFTRYCRAGLVLIFTLLSFNLFAVVRTITVSDFSFSPSSVNANVGDTIRWVWSNGSHTTTSTSVPGGAASWDSPINSNVTSYSYKITAAGTYNYKCTPHAGMVGVINASSSTGISPVAKSNIVGIFPNPFSRNLVIDFRNYDFSVNKPTVQIFDIVGKQYRHIKFIDQFKDGRLYLDLEELDPGVYFIYIINNGKKDIYKIIKSNDYQPGGGGDHSFSPAKSSGENNLES